MNFSREKRCFMFHLGIMYLQKRTKFISRLISSHLDYSTRFTRPMLSTSCYAPHICPYNPILSHLDQPIHHLSMPFTYNSTLPNQPPSISSLSATPSVRQSAPIPFHTKWYLNSSYFVIPFHPLSNKKRNCSRKPTQTILPIPIHMYAYLLRYNEKMFFEFFEVKIKFEFDFGIPMRIKYQVLRSLRAKYHFHSKGSVNIRICISLDKEKQPRGVHNASSISVMNKSKFEKETKIQHPRVVRKPCIDQNESKIKKTPAALLENATNAMNVHRSHQRKPYAGKSLTTASGF